MKAGHVTTVGLLHPGEMGSVVGAAARTSGVEVLWASEGRSALSHARASSAGLVDVGTLAALVRRSEVMISVCPPNAAIELANSVAALQFTGIYVDANAVSPGTAREIAGILESAGASFVDGGIIGPPPAKHGDARLYLSGREAARIADLFADSAIEAIPMETPVGAASALKMSYASWTKTSAALLMAVRALARAEGVEGVLLGEWQRSMPDLPARSAAAASNNAPKAWRFIGEMEEIAATFADAGLPTGFSLAAREIYQRLEHYKDAAVPPSFGEAARSILGE